MKIALLQTDIVWDDIIANTRKLDDLTGRPEVAGSSLIVLPEMWATGFNVHPTAELADRCEAALNWMAVTAERLGAAVAGSLVAQDGDGFRNRFYLVRPDGSTDYYDKRHLFTYGGEDQTYVRGERRVVVPLDEWKVLLQTCYDLRFPAFSRNRTATGGLGADYDLLLYVASWPESRQTAWQTLLRARAIENQCYVCGVNRTGSDPQCRYAGGSAIIDAKGRTLGELQAEEGILTAELDANSLATFRRKFPVLHDADDLHPAIG